MLESERYFSDFGLPMMEEGMGDWDWGFQDVGGGGGGWGEPGWPDSGSGGGGFGVTVQLPPPTQPGAPGGSAPDVRVILTQIANSAEAGLIANLNAWRQGALDADAAIREAWDILNAMTSAMLQYGSQGQISAAERDRRVNPSMLRWDYIALYIDPIAVGSTGSPAAPQPLPAPGSPPVFAEPGAGLGSRQNVLLIGAALVGLILWKARR